MKERISLKTSAGVLQLNPESFISAARLEMIQDMGFTLPGLETALFTFFILRSRDRTCPSFSRKSVTGNSTSANSESPVWNILHCTRKLRWTRSGCGGRSPTTRRADIPPSWILLIISLQDKPWIVFSPVCQFLFHFRIWCSSATESNPGR